MKDATDIDMSDEETLHLTDDEETLHLADNKETLHLTDDEETLHLADNKETLHLTVDEETLHLADNKETLHLTDDEETLRLTDISAFSAPLIDVLSVSQRTCSQNQYVFVVSPSSRAVCRHLAMYGFSSGASFWFLN